MRAINHKWKTSPRSGTLTRIASLKLTGDFVLSLRAIGIAVSLTALISPIAASATPLYNIVELQPVEGTESVATSINNAGQIVGYSAGVSGSFATKWSSSGAPLSLGIGQAYGINDLGQAVGNDTSVAVTWTAGGTETGLGSLGGIHSDARAINNAGVSVGFAADASNQYQLATWSSVGAISQLAVPLGTQGCGGGTAINNGGEIAGTCGNGNYYQAYKWDTAGTPSPLGTAGPFASTTAYGINDSGVVVGSQLTGTGGNALAWLTDGTVLNLAPQLDVAQAQAINDVGAIVGFGYDSGSPEDAMLWSNGQTIDLNNAIDPSFGWYLITALDISNSGQIVGVGFLNGQRRGFLLTPIEAPEPATLTLFGVGLVCAIGARRRYKARL